MATNEDEEPPKPSMRESIAAFYGRTVEAVTDAQKTKLPVRVWVLLMTLAVEIGLASAYVPWPLTVLGIMAVAMLCLAAPVKR